MSLSGILELRKDIGGTIHLPESILCLLMFHFFKLFHIFSNYPGTSSPSVPLPLSVLLFAPIPTPNVSSPVSQMDSTEPHALKTLRIVTQQYTHWPKVLTPQSVLVNSTTVEGLSPPPSVTPSDLDVLIAL